MSFTCSTGLGLARLKKENIKWLRLKNYFRVYRKKSLLPMNDKLVRVSGKVVVTCLVFGSKWLEFISQSQIKSDYNFSKYVPTHSI